MMENGLKQGFRQIKFRVQDSPSLNEVFHSILTKYKLINFFRASVFDRRQA